LDNDLDRSLLSRKIKMYTFKRLQTPAGKMGMRYGSFMGNIFPGNWLMLFAQQFVNCHLCLSNSNRILPKMGKGITSNPVGSAVLQHGVKRGATRASLSKRKLQAIMALSICYLIICTIGLSCDAQNLPKESYLVVTPMVSNATSHYGDGTIPFAVRNNYARDIVVYPEPDFTLMTINGSGDEVSIDAFRRGVQIGSRNPRPPLVTLKPGETGTFAGSYSIENLAFLLNKKKGMFGRIIGCIAGTNQGFESHSDSFPVPAKLATTPFTDLGSQGYFSIVVDLKGAVFQGGDMPDTPVIGGSTYLELIKKHWADVLVIPVKITNLTNQRYIVIVDRTMIYPEASKGTAPSAWDSVQAPGPTVAPGESITPLIPLYLQNQGHRPGDEYLAAVGGRIPNTNQVFECYSAPFELPPLPIDHPTK
jgi:hypothetical protein